MWKEIIIVAYVYVFIVKKLKYHIKNIKYNETGNWKTGGPCWPCIAHKYTHLRHEDSKENLTEGLMLLSYYIERYVNVKSTSIKYFMCVLQIAPTRENLVEFQLRIISAKLFLNPAWTVVSDKNYLIVLLLCRHRNRLCTEWNYVINCKSMAMQGTSMASYINLQPKTWSKTLRLQVQENTSILKILFFV